MFILGILSKNSKLKLPVGCSIKIYEFTFTKSSSNHNQPQFRILVDLDLAFRILANALFIPPDHDICSTHKSSAKKYYSKQSNKSIIWL